MVKRAAKNWERGKAFHDAKQENKNYMNFKSIQIVIIKNNEHVE